MDISKKWNLTGAGIGTDPYNRNSKKSRKFTKNNEIISTVLFSQNPTFFAYWKNGILCTNSRQLHSKITQKSRNRASADILHFSNIYFFFYNCIIELIFPVDTLMVPMLMLMEM